MKLNLTLKLLILGLSSIISINLNNNPVALHQVILVLVHDEDLIKQV